MKLAEVLLHALRAHGARQIFGIPGDFALPFFKVIEESGILPLYTLSHEPAVGFAADATARMNCALGVAAVTYGAGALNMVNAIAGAYAERSPVVVISGAPGKGEAGTGLLLHHQAKTLDSQFRIYSEITCEQVVLDDATRAPAHIARALARCRTESRPVYIELPRDMVGASAGPVTPLPPDTVDGDALAACVDEILARLAAATDPVLMVGVEVRRYALEGKVAELARRLGLPVVTSMMGRGLLANADAPLLGTYLGVAGDPAITARVEGSDALFLLGVIISDTNFGVSARKIDLRRTIRALAGEVTLGYHTYPALPLPALVDAMLARVAPRSALPAAPRPQHPRGLVADDTPLVPADIARAINDLMAARGRMPIATDVGPVHRDGHRPHVAGRTWLLRVDGLRRAGRPRRAGGLRRTAADPGRRRRVPDDRVGARQLPQARLGSDRHRAQRFNDLDDWNFAAVAPALGGEGVRVHTRREFKGALDAAVERHGRFQLIEAMIPRGVLSDTLARFVAGVKRISAGKG